MGVAVGFSLKQFEQVFKIRNEAGRPYLLIGGQAVNYWAERYLATEPELKAFQPFPSEDIDFKGNRDDVRRIAQQSDLQPVFPPKVAMTALSGTIPFKVGELRSNIEVIRRVPGVPVAVEELAFEAELHGRTIRVLDPISLLACKIPLLGPPSVACQPKPEAR